MEKKEMLEKMITDYSIWILLIVGLAISIKLNMHSIGGAIVGTMIGRIITRIVIKKIVI